jgi:hypothetical protein
MAGALAGVKIVELAIWAAAPAGGGIMNAPNTNVQFKQRQQSAFSVMLSQWRNQRKERLI